MWYTPLRFWICILMKLWRVARKTKSGPYKSPQGVCPWQPLGQFRIADSHIPNYVSLDCGRKVEKLERTHTNEWGTGTPGPPHSDDSGQPVQPYCDKNQSMRFRNTRLPCSVANRVLTIGVKIFFIQVRSGGAIPVRSMIRNTATSIQGSKCFETTALNTWCQTRLHSCLHPQFGSHLFPHWPVIPSVSQPYSPVYSLLSCINHARVPRKVWMLHGFGF